jgi:hypothetical protein
VNPDDRAPVDVIDADEPASPRRQRVGTSDLLAAIEDIPGQVAALVKGGKQPEQDGVPEVRFVGEEPLPMEPVVTEPEDSNGLPADQQPKPDPELHRPLFRHPSARRRSVDALA